MDCSFGIHGAVNCCLNDFEVMSMGECRFNECRMHMCHGERCRGCCNPTGNAKKELDYHIVTKENGRELFATLQETIKSYSDAELFRLQRLLQAEKQNRRRTKPKSHARRGSVRRQKLKEQVHIKLDNDGKRKRAILIKEIKPKPPFNDKS